MMLVFCRHGETSANREYIFQGASDTPLTEKGKRQAKSLNGYLKTLPFITQFILSPYPRAVATYKIASEGINAPVAYEPALREISYGDWDGKKRASMDKSLLQKRDRDRFNFAPSGSYKGQPGESYADLYARLVPFLESLLRNTNKEAIIAIIAHLGVTLCAKKYFLLLSDQEAGKLYIPNTQVFLVSKKDDSHFTTNSIEI